ncbi:N-acetyl-alpha-D-glucosaminyl L-malate synthase BshA [Acidobacteriota bacterium]
MKIGITCYPTYGGSGVVATELGKALARRGHEVHFICSRMPYRLSRPVEKVFYHEVEVMNYPVFQYTPYSLALASKMVYVADRVNLDLLHVHYAIPHAASAILARQVRTSAYLPVITTLHGTDITVVGNDPSYLPITEHSINQSDGVTAVSEFLKKATHQELRITRDIRVIPNFVDLSIFQKTPCGKTFKSLSPKGEKLLMHISNFRPVKRIPDVIRTFHAVQKEIDARLVLVGDGPERPAAESLANELGLPPDRVLFLGKLEVTAGVLACADILLLPSDAESFGLVALEALACEVPVVGALAGGLPEVVDHGVTGYLCPVGKWDLMARSCIQILSDPALKKKMGKAGREKALDCFTTDKVLTMYEALYEEVIDGR